MNEDQSLVANEDVRVNKKYLNRFLSPSLNRDVTTGATGATAVKPKFSDTLTLSQPRGQNSQQVTDNIFSVVTSLQNIVTFHEF